MILKNKMQIYYIDILKYNVLYYYNKKGAIKNKCRKEKRKMKKYLHFVATGYWSPDSI